MCINFLKIGTRSVHVGSRKKISKGSQVISGFVMPHLLHYSVSLYLLTCKFAFWVIHCFQYLPTPQDPKMVCKSMINSNQDYDHGLAQVNFVRTHEWKSYMISEISKFSFQTHKTHSWESCTNLNNGII